MQIGELAPRVVRRMPTGPGGHIGVAPGPADPALPRRRRNTETGGDRSAKARRPPVLAGWGCGRDVNAV